MYVEESLFFLQWDMILVVLAYAIWISRTMEGLYDRSGKGWDPTTTAAIIVGSSIVCLGLGPGAVVSGLLYVRENYIRSSWAVKQQAKSLHQE